jgi:phosphohistidine phosphatase
MKTLLILRHAKSSRDDPTLADHDRPLAKRGLRDAPRMGELLFAERLVPDLILSSTAVRALQTAMLAAQACRYDRELRTVPELYLAEAATYLAVVREVDDRHERVMLVGHNPGMEELLVAVTGHAERMPTGALAQVRFAADRWAEVSVDGPGDLVQLWCPKEL